MTAHRSLICPHCASPSVSIGGDGAMKEQRMCRRGHIYWTASAPWKPPGPPAWANYNCDACGAYFEDAQTMCPHYDCPGTVRPVRHPENVSDSDYDTFPA